MANSKQAKFIVDVSAESKHTRKSSVRFFSYDSKTAEIVIQAEKDNELIPRGTISNVEIYFESVNSSYRPTESLKWNDQMTINDDGLFLYTLTDDLLNYQGLVAFEVYINYINNDKSDSSNRIIYEQRTSAIDRAPGEIEIVYIKDMETAKKEVADKAAEVKESLAGYDSGLDIYADQKKTEMDNFTRNVQETSINEITKIQNELPKVKQVNVDETKKIKAEYPIVEQVATTEKEKIRAVLSTVDQTASEVSAYADRKISEYDAKFTQSNQKMNDLQQSQTALTTKLTETQQKITDSDVFTKAESSVNVINSIGGAESAILKKELLVNGTEGTASRHLQDLPLKNLAFKGNVVDPDLTTYRPIQGDMTPVTWQKNKVYTLYVKMKKFGNRVPTLYNTGSNGAFAPKKAKEGYITTFTQNRGWELSTYPGQYNIYGIPNSGETCDVEYAMILEGIYTEDEILKYGYFPSAKDYGIVHGQPNLWNGTSSTPAEKIITGWNDLYITRSISSMGIIVGDKVTYKLLIDNSKTPTGNGKARALLRCLDNNGTELLLKGTAVVNEGSKGYATCELTVPENTVTLGIAKYAKDNGDTSKPVTISVSEEKLIKGTLAAMDEWTPSQTDSGLTPINGGVVTLTNDEYTTLLSEDGIVRAETKVVGRGAEIEFKFDVIGTLERKYPYLFVGLSSMAEKIAKFKLLWSGMSTPFIARGGGLRDAKPYNFAGIYIRNRQAYWWGISAINNSDKFVSIPADTWEYNGHGVQVQDDGSYIFRIVSNNPSNSGAISDGVTPAWVEVKDIKLIVELEVNGRTIIEEMIAAYCRPLEQQINDLAQKVAAMENK